MEKIEIGSLKFEVTRQALIAFSLSAFAFLLVLAGKLASIKNRSAAVYVGFGIVAVIFIAYAFFIGYIVNCTIVGKCIKLSWFIVGCYAFLVIMYVFAAIGILTMKPTEERLTMIKSPMDFSKKK